MERQSQLAFLLLILVQAVHSIEEYITRLYDVFAPARFISGLVSSNLPVGFLVANVALVAFGCWCWLIPVRSRWPSARAVAWGWAVVELGNGLGHTTMAFARGGYFPGVLTAPLLIVGAIWLASRLIRTA